MIDSIYIKSVVVQNLGGISIFKAEMGQIAVVQGENGSGKTSFLQAIHSVLEGGHSPDLVRQGADEAKVIITLSNEVVITKTITEKESTLEVVSPDGGKVRAPATFVKNLVPKIEGTGSFDPIGFLAADQRDKAAFLLKVLPISFEASEITGITKLPLSGSIGLEKFNEIREGLYARRTEINRQARDLEGTVATMERGLPADDSTNWADERDRITSSISAVDTEIETVGKSIEIEAEQARSGKRQEISGRREDLLGQIAALDAELASFLATVEKTVVSSRDEQTADLRARRAVLSEQLGEAKTKADQQQRAVGVKQAISEQRMRAQLAVDQEMVLTKQLKLLDILKSERLRTLPIPGFDIRIDAKGRPDILIDGIPLDNLNRQQQIYIAIRAVKLAVGPLPLIIAESAELDDNHAEELKEAAREAGLQLVLARWKNDAPLEVIAA